MMIDNIKQWLRNQNVFTGTDEILNPNDTELARLVHDCIKDLNLVEADQWVSVDIIPEIGVCFLLQVDGMDGKYQIEGFYDGCEDQNYEGGYFDWDGEILNNVTHRKILDIPTV